MDIVSDLTEGFILESEVDEVGLWVITGNVTRLLGRDADPRTVFDLSMRIARNLIRANVRPGVYTDSEFQFWSGSEDELIQRIAEAWHALGRMPDLRDTICWFCPPPEVWAAHAAAAARSPT